MSDLHFRREDELDVREGMDEMWNIATPNPTTVGGSIVLRNGDEGDTIANAYEMIEIRTHDGDNYGLSNCDDSYLNGAYRQAGY